MQILTLALVLLTGFGQPTSDSPLAPPPDGPRHADPTYHVFLNATIHPAPGETIVMGAIAVRDGRVIQVHRPTDAAMFAHEGARVWDCEGLHIYPGFIEPFLEVDAPAPGGDPANLHWNDRVTPQRRATDGEGPTGRDAEALRKLGFVAAGVSPENGIFRGRAAVVSLAAGFDDDSKGERPVYRDDVYQTLSFSTGGFGGGYPNSQMGAIALMRQTLSDADWQASVGREGAPNALDALGRDAPLLFVTRDELEALRAAKIAREFDREAIVLGSGDEYKRLDALVADDLPLIVPIDFPDAPSVDSIGAEDSVELLSLMEWEQAPYNPRRLDEADREVALTTTGDRSGFLNNLRTAVEHGLAQDSALAMITTQPANLLDVDDLLGTIIEGKIASFVVADGDLFDKKTKIRDVWVDGRRHEINAGPEADISGVWQVAFGDMEGPRLVIDSKNSITLEAEGEEPLKARHVKRNGQMLSYVVDQVEDEESILVSAVVAGDDMAGTLRTADGHTMAWTATRIEQGDDDDADAAPAAQAPNDPVAGTWRMMAHNVELFGPNGVPFTLQIDREGDSLTGTFDAEPVEGEVSDVSFEDGVLQLSLTVTGGDVFRMTAMITGDNAAGRSVSDASGMAMDIEGTRAAAAIVERDAPETDEMPALPGYPFGPYAMTGLPEQQAVVFTNATIWTSGSKGVIENGWLIIDEGRIVAVGDGPHLNHDGAPVIDLDGAHITPGIIDAHSHTGMSRGLNESGQAVTAEVRVADITNPDAVNWYRQLAGGVTTVNNLHGSANPIGGQSQTNKLRWGAAHPDDMHMEGAVPGIKFALGENVKQSNWSNPSGRYPQTRMGVETLIRDRFVAAQEYAQRHSGYGERPRPAGGATSETYIKPTVAPRRDLELEALAEILAGDRLIHCHSYRQDEILMLCRIAEEFDFTIGSFQHVLEGYKVAEAIRENAYGGSSFSDWWAYKVEVQDAIPHNGAIMHDVGVVVSFNSDSDELARRLNTEAAKAVRYGGVEPAEALKFVTLNPAIQLGVSDRIGSIEAGKDADLAIWSGDPLSTFSICTQTWIDGRQFFSLEADAEHRARNAAERKRLVQKILTKGMKKPAKADDDDKAEDTTPPERMTVAQWREMQMRHAIREHNLDLIQRGLNPADHRCGECGVTITDLFANER